MSRPRRQTIRSRGFAHELEIPLTLHIAGDDLRVQASYGIPYVEWGLKDPSVFLLRVKKRVDVTIDLVGRLRRTPDPSPVETTTAQNRSGQ